MPHNPARPAPNTLLVPAAAQDQTPGVAAALSVGNATLAPLFILLPAEDETWSPYTLMSYTGDDILYIALPGHPVIGDPAEPAASVAWAAVLTARHREHARQLNNHQCWFRNALPGLEVEHKFTLPTDTDIWRLAVHTHHLARNGALPGWICEHGNNGGFEQWDFVNHLFEITEPAHERGYIAFIPGIDKPGWVIRRKRFDHDQPIRREDLTEGVELGPHPDLRHVIQDRFGLQPNWGATYRRVRYNVMLESLATGHIFSIMYDQCTTDHADRPPLVQA